MATERERVVTVTTERERVVTERQRVVTERQRVATESGLQGEVAAASARAAVSKANPARISIPNPGWLSFTTKT